jgi:hypothetical protein
MRGRSKFAFRLCLSRLPDARVNPEDNGAAACADHASAIEDRQTPGRTISRIPQLYRVNGLVVKADDDLMSATSGLWMGIRLAKPLAEKRNQQSAYGGNDGTFHRIGGQQRAIGVHERDSYSAL